MKMINSIECEPFGYVDTSLKNNAIPITEIEIEKVEVTVLPEPKNLKQNLPKSIISDLIKKK